MLLEPSKATLRKYGLSVEEWSKMAEEQHHACFICQLEPKKGRLCIDHFHIKGWKKMAPEVRKLFVRGLLCWICNTRILTRGISVAKLKRAVEYLEKYEALKAAQEQA